MNFSFNYLNILLKCIISTWMTHYILSSLRTRTESILLTIAFLLLNTYWYEVGMQQILVSYQVYYLMYVNNHRNQELWANGNVQCLVAHDHTLLDYMKFMIHSRWSPTALSVSVYQSTFFFLIVIFGKSFLMCNQDGSWYSFKSICLGSVSNRNGKQLDTKPTSIWRPLTYNHLRKRKKLLRCPQCYISLKEMRKYECI